jgi:hypothetical protein
VFQQTEDRSPARPGDLARVEVTDDVRVISGPADQLIDPGAPAEDGPHLLVAAINSTGGLK